MFQISIYKDTIYSLEELNKLIETFINYFSYQFEFKIEKENVNFTYIFHTKDKNKLFEACKEKQLKCIFFNPSFQRFTDVNNIDLNEINSIDNIFVNPFILINKNLDIDMKDMIDINKLNSITKVNFILNNKQKKSIEKFWKNRFGKDTLIEICFSHNTHFIDEQYLSNEIIYFRAIDANELKEWIEIIAEEDEQEIMLEENYLLLIYRQINLEFILISENGEIFELKYIPVGRKCGLRNYDIYIAKSSLKK